MSNVIHCLRKRTLASSGCLEDKIDDGWYIQIHASHLHRQRLYHFCVNDSDSKLSRATGIA